MAKRPFANDKLSCIGPVETVYAVGSCHAVLYLGIIVRSSTVPEKPSPFQNIFSY